MTSFLLSLAYIKLLFPFFSYVVLWGGTQEYRRELLLCWGCSTMLWTLLLLIDHQFICDSVCSIANATKDHYCIVGIERLVLMDTIGGRHFSCGITRRMEVSFSFYGYFFRRTVCQKCNFVPNTGCPNKFRILFWSSEMNVSEASIVYESYQKFVFCSIKLLF